MITHNYSALDRWVVMGLALKKTRLPYMWMMRLFLSAPCERNVFKMMHEAFHRREFHAKSTS